MSLVLLVLCARQMSSPFSSKPARQNDHTGKGDKGESQFMVTQKVSLDVGTCGSTLNTHTPAQRKYIPISSQFGLISIIILGAPGQEMYCPLLKCVCVRVCVRVCVCACVCVRQQTKEKCLQTIICFAGKVETTVQFIDNWEEKVLQECTFTDREELFAYLNKKLTNQKVLPKDEDKQEEQTQDDNNEKKKKRTFREYVSGCAEAFVAVAGVRDPPGCP